MFQHKMTQEITNSFQQEWHLQTVIQCLMYPMEERLTRFLKQFACPLALPCYFQLNICHDVAFPQSHLCSIHRDQYSNDVLLIGGTDIGINLHKTPLTQCSGTLIYMSPEALTTLLAIPKATRQFPTIERAIVVLVPENECHEGDSDLVEPDLSLPIAERLPADELCEKPATLPSNSVEQASEQVSSLQPSEQISSLRILQQELGKTSEEDEQQLDHKAKDLFKQVLSDCCVTLHIKSEQLKKQVMTDYTNQLQEANLQVNQLLTKTDEKLKATVMQGKNENQGRVKTEKLNISELPKTEDYGKCLLQSLLQSTAVSISGVHKCVTQTQQWEEASPPPPLKIL